MGCMHCARGSAGLLCIGQQSAWLRATLVSFVRARKERIRIRPPRAPGPRPHATRHTPDACRPLRLGAASILHTHGTHNTHTENFYKTQHLVLGVVSCNPCSFIFIPCSYNPAPAFESTSWRTQHQHPTPTPKAKAQEPKDRRTPVLDGPPTHQHQHQHQHRHRFA
jgi:hypothetical protein